VAFRTDERRDVFTVTRMVKRAFMISTSIFQGERHHRPIYGDDAMVKAGLSEGFHVPCGLGTVVAG
jgi:hypothetical protein